MQEELAPAKINLALAITGRRVDGYHNIDTVMHSITLSDSVFFSPADELIFRCNDLSLPLGAGNLAWEAAQLVRRYVGQRRGVAIQLNKRIPAGSGLGGGSSDAAAVLRGLNRFWQLGLTDAELLWLASRLGSDVPFCVFGGCARGREKGDARVARNEFAHCHAAAQRGERAGVRAVRYDILRGDGRCDRRGCGVGTTSRDGMATLGQ